MTDRAALLDDLREEGDELERLVVDLAATQWARPTPAAGWTIAHQIAHLAWTDRIATLAAADEDAFTGHLRRAEAEPQAYVDTGAEQGAAVPPAELLEIGRAHV